MSIFFQKKTINLGGKILKLSKPRIMGIINATPDSFYDGGKYKVVDDILHAVEKMMKDGADFIDIGGYSSRPGAADISPDEELMRVIEPIATIRERFPECILSIDTFHSKVAQKAIKAGANMVNDITAGTADPKMLKVVLNHQVPYIIMHMQGKPKTMQQNPEYINAPKEIFQYLGEKVSKFQDAGIRDVLIDPGFGFGKTLEHNYQILKNLDLFHLVNAPIVVGISRKSMINRVLKIKPQAALNGTSVLNTIALLKRADILRVHDVKEAREAIKLVSLYQETE